MKCEFFASSVKFVKCHSEYYYSLGLCILRLAFFANNQTVDVKMIRRFMFYF